MKLHDKEGNELTGKEFLERWKKGIQAVTPLQSTGVTLYGYAIVVLGIVWGIIASSMTGVWWLCTILVGSLVVTTVQVIGAIQKYLILKNLDTMLR